MKFYKVNSKVGRSILRELLAAVRAEHVAADYFNHAVMGFVLAVNGSDEEKIAEIMLGIMYKHKVCLDCGGRMWVANGELIHMAGPHITNEPERITKFDEGEAEDVTLPPTLDDEPDLGKREELIGEALRHAFGNDWLGRRDSGDSGFGRPR